MKRVTKIKRAAIHHDWSSPHYGDVFCAAGLTTYCNVPKDALKLDLVLSDVEPTEDTDYYRVRVGGSGIMVQAPDPDARWMRASTYFGIDHIVRDFTLPAAKESTNLYDDWPVAYIWLEYDA